MRHRRPRPVHTVKFFNRGDGWIEVVQSCPDLDRVLVTADRRARRREGSKWIVRTLTWPVIRARIPTVKVVCVPAPDSLAAARVVLGLHESATEEDIRKAYRKLAFAAHPDRGGSVEEWHRISDAYNTLKRKE